MREMSFMKYRRIINFALLFASAAIFLAACGGGSTTNVIVDTVAPVGQVVVAGTVASFSSTVTGATVTTSKWTCTFVYTPLPTTAQPSPTPTTAAPCTSGMSVNGGTIGTWTTTDTASPNVLVYSAPPLASFPNPIPVLTFTATADASSKATGTATVGLDTGIRVTVQPAAATVPVGVTPAQTAQFTPFFINGPATNVAWLLTQPNSSSTTQANQTANPNGATCSPTCGTVDSNGIYTAPATLPTDTTPPKSASTAPTTVYLVVNSKNDLNHYAVATIVLINSSTNPITFQGITPTVAAAGGILQDIFLNAHNLLNTTSITFTDPNGFPTVLPPTQVFTIPISLAYCTPSASGVTPVVNCDASILTRVRLNQSQLAVPGTATLTVSGLTGDTTGLGPGCTAGTLGGSTSVTCPLNLVYTSPAMVSAVPDSFPQNSSGGIQFSADGGYYGTGVNLLFNGGGLLSPTSGPRQFTGQLPNSQLQNPGLYPVSIRSNAPVATPPPFPTVTTNVAVQPIFADVNSAYNPTPTTPVYPPNIPLSAGQNLAPSSMAVNSTRGYAVITDQAANGIQVITLPATGTGVPVVGALIPLGNQPTSVAIDNQISLSAPYAGDDLGVVVSSGDNSLRLVALTPTSAIPITSIDLSGLITQTGATATPPAPYAVGVDPTTHRAVIAYSNSVVGFIADINPNTDGSDKTACFPSSVAQKPPCVIASVSLNTGPTPQVVMQPQVPLAYVTPGGAGVTSVVNLELTNIVSPIASSSNAPAGAVRSSNLVTITTTEPNGINPSLGGTVLIAGVTPADFNGSYQVTPGSITTYSFTYTQAGTNETGGGGTVLYGSPYYTFSTTSTASGAAINPVTRTFAYADYNATTSSQIGFISTLDQTLSTLSLSAGSCQNAQNPCLPNPAGAPEGGFRSVAFDPFTNVLVAYDPSENVGSEFPGNAISLINPGSLSAAGSIAPYRIVQAIKTGQPGTGSYTPSGATAAVPVYGPMGYDPKTNLVLVANAGSNTLTYLNLNISNSFKKLNVGSLQVTQGGVASTQPPLGSAPATCDLSDPTGAHACMAQAVTIGQTAALRVFGQGFGTAPGAQIRLDGSTTGVTTTWVSDSEVDATIAPATLTVPHVFALDVIAGGVTSNTMELHALIVKDLKLALACDPLAVAGSTPSLLGQGPEGVAIDTQRHVAIITNFSCASISIINLDTTGTLYPGKVYGDILKTFAVGSLPIGVDVIPRLGYAVVSNNGDNTASIVDITDPLNPKLAVTPNVAVGISPTGVTFDQDRALALVANTGSNTLATIDLTVLLPGSVTTTVPIANSVALSGPPKAIAVDPNRGVAVVTDLQNSGTSSASGGLDVVSIASVPPVKNSNTSINGLTSNPTGITFDPAVSPALFYITSTQQNAVYTFNPDSTATSQIRVGVNPYSIAYNFQTGTMLTLNTTSNTMSIVDTQDFHTTETLGITSQSQFASAMDNFTNTAVIVDQNNNRVLIVAMPK